MLNYYNNSKNNSSYVIVFELRKLRNYERGKAKHYSRMITFSILKLVLSDLFTILLQNAVLSNPPSEKKTRVKSEKWKIEIKNKRQGLFDETM